MLQEIKKIKPNTLLDEKQLSFYFYQVPAFENGSGTTLFESNAIAYYGKYPDTYRRKIKDVN